MARDMGSWEHAFSFLLEHAIKGVDVHPYRLSGPISAQVLQPPNRLGLVVNVQFYMEPK